MLAEKLDVIRVDVWTSIVPAGTLTPLDLWSNVALPDARIWETTKHYGFPMNITFLNATSYKVCMRARRPHVAELHLQRAALWHALY